MKHKLSITLLLMSLLFTACSTASNAGEATPEAPPVVVADTSIIAEGRVEPFRFAEIAFNAGGVANEVLVEEGQPVKKGQPLVRLGNSEAARAEVAKAQEALIIAERAFSSSQADTLKILGDAYEAVRIAQINLDNYDIPSFLAGGTPAEGVEKMYARLEEAREAYEPYQYLSKDNEIKKAKKKQLDNAWERFNRAIRWAKLEAKLQQAQSELDNAQSEFASTSSGSQDGSLARARYETAQANLLAAQAALTNVELVAPFDGVVAGLSVNEGGSINAGEIAVAVADFSSWLVKTTDLTEIDVVALADGQPVTVTLDAIPGMELRGNILSIGQDYSEKQGDVVYEVTILLTDQNPAMRWGMTASVVFENED